MFNEEAAIKDYEHFSGNLHEESDRGCVLVVAAILDYHLEMLLRAEFSQDPTTIKRVINPLFKGEAPLASFWFKAQLAYSLSLIPDWIYEDLDHIRKLRNKFAHRFKPADFEDPEVIRLTEKLRGANYPIRHLKSSPQPPERQKSSISSPNKNLPPPKKERFRFIMTATWIAAWMSTSPGFSQIKRDALTSFNIVWKWDGRS